MHHLVVVIGATGNVGAEIVRRLRARGQKVRALGRDMDRLKPLADLGAETMAGTAEDAAFLVHAFAGAGAVFAMIPPNFTTPDARAYQARVADALGAALGPSEATHIVSLSSLGAELPGGTGPIAGLHHFEQKLNALPGKNVVHLRAAYFMENHLASIGPIKAQGVNAGAFRPDVRMAMIATRDIGAVAADLLAACAFAGRSVRELQGPRDFTPAEATAILGRAVGKPDLAYVQLPYDTARQGLMGMGLSGSVAESIVEMARAFNEGRVKALEPRSNANTTPTTLEEFAAKFAAIYGAR